MNVSRNKAFRFLFNDIAISIVSVYLIFKMMNSLVFALIYTRETES